jgi:flavin reductase (DIM6/NTAB) family NADH-FMN oxidoreductase RutF
MKKVLPEDKYLQGGPPTSVVLVTCVDADGKPNIITLGMFMYISQCPPQVCIGVAPSRYSHDLIVCQGEFAVNLPSVEIVEEMHRCGIISGRDVDKFEETGLTPIPAQKINSPLIAECYGHLECRVVQGHTCGDHYLIVGEVVAASVDVEAVDENNNQILTRTNPVIQKNWSYHTVKKIAP